MYDKQEAQIQPAPGVRSPALADPWAQASPRKPPQTMSWTCSSSITATHGASQGDPGPAEALFPSTKDGSRSPKGPFQGWGVPAPTLVGVHVGEHVAEATVTRRNTSNFPASFPRRASKSEMRDSCWWWEVPESALERNERTNGRERQATNKHALASHSHTEHPSVDALATAWQSTRGLTTHQGSRLHHHVRDPRRCQQLRREDPTWLPAADKLGFLPGSP